MESGRGWLAGDWPSTGGVLNITAAAWTAGFLWWRSGNKKRTHNVSEYTLVLALCLVYLVLNEYSFPGPGACSLSGLPLSVCHSLSSIYRRVANPSQFSV